MDAIRKTIEIVAKALVGEALEGVASSPGGRVVLRAYQLAKKASDEKREIGQIDIEALMGMIDKLDDDDSTPGSHRDSKPGDPNAG